MLEKLLRGGEINKALRGTLEVQQTGVSGKNKRLKFDRRIAQNDLVSGDLVEVRQRDVDEISGCPVRAVAYSLPRTRVPSRRINDSCPWS